MRTPAELTDAFRARGLKLTPQRQLLFRLLHDTSAHPSAEALHSAAAEVMPGISLRTVYQTLHDLVAMGELQQIDFVPGSARFDPNVGEHQHLVCSGCGLVRDVVVDLSGLAMSDADGGSFEGFELDSTDIVFRGRCSTCAATARGESTGTPAVDSSRSLPSR